MENKYWFLKIFVLVVPTIAIFYAFSNFKQPSNYDFYSWDLSLKIGYVFCSLVWTLICLWINEKIGDSNGK